MAGQAVDSATRMLKEGNMDSVKMEGGIGSRVAAAKAISEAGIAVMGHVGLTPQAISILGGFRPQGRSSARALLVCTVECIISNSNQSFMVFLLMGRVFNGLQIGEVCLER